MLVLPDLAAVKGGDMDLIVCSLEPWDEVWRRNQYLVDGLLRRDPNLRVVFIEPSCDPLHLMRIRQRPRLGGGLRTVPGYGGRLQCLELTKWLPRSAGSLADQFLGRGVMATARRLRMTDPVLWVNDPGWAHLVTVSGWPALYDITDDWVAANRPPREHERIVANEGILMEACGVVVVCSPILGQTKGRMRPVVMVQNAVDLARYREPLPRPDDLGERAAVYVGTLHEDRLDVDLSCRIGRRLAADGGSLVFVGPNALTQANSEQLASTPGVRILGPKPYQIVPAYLQHAGVLVVPHKMDDFTDSLDPIKLYEYQAAGRPIAATPVSGFNKLQDASGVLIRRAEELPEAVARLLGNPPSRVGPFEVPDWSERVDSMQSVLHELTGGRRIVDGATR